MTLEAENLTPPTQNRILIPNTGNNLKALFIRHTSISAISGK